MLHRLTTDAPSYDPNDILPHAIHQLALLGIYLLPTNFPIANHTLARLIEHDIHTTTMGYPNQPNPDNTSPLKHILNDKNTTYTLIDPTYRSILLTIHSLASTMDTEYHKAVAYTETQYLPDFIPPPDLEPPHTSYLRKSMVTAAANELQPQYNHLSHFLQLDFLQHPHYAQPSNFLNTHDLFPTQFQLYSMFPIHTSTRANWKASPEESLRQFQRQNTLTSSSDHGQFSHVHYILDTYASPLLFSSDSGHNRHTGFTVASSILMAFHTDQNHPTDPIMLDKPPHPILLRNHILAETYGTKVTDNNMGEAQGLILSLHMAPPAIPTIFLIDSRILLLQVMAYFNPHSTTIRKQLRQHIHTTSIHHYSELHQALARHWPNVKHRSPSTATHHPHYLVLQHFNIILTSLTHNLGPDAIIRLQQTDTKLADTISDTTHGFVIGNHLFLHIHSHQLTNRGALRVDPETKTKIQPTPNISLATANTWADRAATRMAQTLPQATPPLIQEHIPHPPMTSLQYTYMHNSRLVNSDMSIYLKEQFVNHNMYQALQREDQWHLHLLPKFTDPTKSFQSNHTLRSLAQERAISHQRLLRTKLAYRQHYQTKCHPFQKDLPRNVISTQMQQCPLCAVITPIATSLHFHLHCNHHKIARQRKKVTKPINNILCELDMITTFMIQIIHPNNSRRHNRIPPFTTFLRTVINHHSIITELTSQDRQSYHSNAVYPPLKHLPCSDPPNWQGHHLTNPPNQLTLAHTTYLLGTPEETLPPYPTTIFHVIPLLGLLPTNTHMAIHEYMNMIHHKFSMIQRATLHHSPPQTSANITLQLIRPHITDTSLLSLLQSYKDTDTLLSVLQNKLTTLLRNLIKKPTNLQKEISRILQSDLERVTPTSPTPTVPSTRKRPREWTIQDSPDIPMQNKKPKRSKKLKPRLPHQQVTTYPCPGTWCTLRRAKKLSYTISTTRKRCTLCTNMHLALTIATTIIDHIIHDESAISLLLQYTMIDPQQFTIDDISTNLSNLDWPLVEIKDILSNVISHTETKLYISNKITFLHPNDALYEQPDTQLQDIVLKLVAYTSLISTTQPFTEEFPPLDEHNIHHILTQAMSPCICPVPCPIPTLHTNLCQHCSNLIIHQHASLNPHSPQTCTTCITCDKPNKYARYTQHPCATCIMTAVLIQRNPKETWHSITRDTSPSVLPFLLPTPYEYITRLPRINGTPFTTPLPPEDIYHHRDQNHPRPYTLPNTDPDFPYQDCYEEESFLDMRIFPPRPPFKAFPKHYAPAASANAITITNLHLALHPALYRPDHARLYLHYKRPSFPKFEGIDPPSFGNYHEMYFHENVQALARAMPQVDIHHVDMSLPHPNPLYKNASKDWLHTTVTWSFQEYPQPRTKCPNERIYTTPETFIITFYPPIYYFRPFQLRLFFLPVDMDRDAPPPHTSDSMHTDVIAVLSLDKDEHPTLYALTLIYLIITLPPQFLHFDTVSAFMINYPNNLRKLNEESSYLHAILRDANYSQTLHHITTPWKLTYNKEDDEYSDHPNDRIRQYNPDNPNT